MPDLPSFVQNNIDNKSMILPHVLGLLILMEKFSLEDIVDADNSIKEIEDLCPVYKSTYDEFIVSDTMTQPNEFYQGLDDANYTGGPQPIFRALFDWTSPTARRLGTDSETWPIQVQIRIQLVEPQADTISPVGARRFLRGGNLQFLVHTANEISIGDGRPTGEIFKVAQYYIDKYGSKNARQLFDCVPDVKRGLDGSLTRQFQGLTNATLKLVLEKILPYIQLSDEPPYYSQILNYMKTFQTFAAITANLRFAPLDRPNVPQRGLLDPNYGLAVTIPFTYEQIK